MPVIYNTAHFMIETSPIATFKGQKNHRKNNYVSALSLPSKCEFSSAPAFL